MGAPLQHPMEGVANAAGAVGTLAPAVGSRWVPLDYFRFLAVLLMVQGHTFNVLIDESIRPETWYRWHAYIHGYTAPMFLFASGLAFGVATFRHWNRHLTLNATVRRRLERYLLIIGIGYLLHLPGFAVSELSGASAAQVRNLLKVDALQNIGLTLIGCELAIAALRRRNRYVGTLAVLMGVLVIAAPWIWRWNAAEVLPTALAGYVNNGTGSIFPLAPWAGFILAGIVSAHVIERYRQRHGVRPKPMVVANWAIALMAASLLGHGLVTRSGIDVFGEHNFWKTNPWWFVWRVAVALAVLAILGGIYERFVQPRAHTPSAVRKTITVLGQETLVIYVAHIILLYGSPLHTGFHRSVGKTLPVSEALMAFGLVMALMVGLAWLWHQIKTRRPSEFNIGRLIALAGLLLYVFALG